MFVVFSVFFVGDTLKKYAINIYFFYQINKWAPYIFFFFTSINLNQAEVTTRVIDF